MNKAFEFFEHFARQVAIVTGRPVTFALALLVILLWAFTGPIFGYSDTWQLIINTGTTIVTFLMIFLVQSAQNRDSKAIQLKLDELILKMNKADNLMLDIEQLTERELDALAERYNRIRGQQAGGRGRGEREQSKRRAGRTDEPAGTTASPRTSAPATATADAPATGRRRRRRKAASPPSGPADAR